MLELTIMDDGIEPTPRNMITRTKLFESKLVMICDQIRSKLELHKSQSIIVSFFVVEYCVS